MARRKRLPAQSKSKNLITSSVLPCVLLWLSFCSLPENRRTDTHSRRSFLDGHLEVMRHAHREHVHANARHLAPRDRVAQFAQLLKEGSCALGIVGEWRNCHDRETPIPRVAALPTTILPVAANRAKPRFLPPHRQR